MVFKDFKDKLWFLMTFKDRVNFFRILRNLRTSGRPVIIRTCKQTKLNAPSITVVISFKAIRNELCTECSFSAIELHVWRSVMRELASAAERRASAVNLSSVPSPQRSSYYALPNTEYNRLLHKFRHRSTPLCVGTQVYQIQ